MSSVKVVGAVVFLLVGVEEGIDVVVVVVAGAEEFSDPWCSA